MTRSKGNMAELCASMNALGQQLQLSLEMSRTDKQKNLVIILYTHDLSLFQNMLVCTDTKRAPDARTLVMQLLDASFATAAACGHRRLIDHFYEAGNKQRIFHLRAYQSLPRDVGGKISKLSGFYFADIAGLTDYYAKLYGLVNVGTSPVTQCHRLSIVSCECLFLVIRSVVDFFRIRDLDKEYYQNWQQFLQFAQS